jgi:hypothetical protein
MTSGKGTMASTLTPTSDKIVTSQEDDLSFARELWAFLRVRKKFWLLPVIVMALVFGAFLILAQSSAIAPFIYTLF